VVLVYRHVDYTAIWWNDWEYHEKLNPIILQAYINAETQANDRENDLHNLSLKISQ
jgi:hypothetical protein